MDATHSALETMEGKTEKESPRPSRTAWHLTTFPRSTTRDDWASTYSQFSPHGRASEKSVTRQLRLDQDNKSIYNLFGQICPYAFVDPPDTRGQ